MNRYIRSALLMVCGIVTGVVLMYVLAIVNIRQEGGREIIEPKLFGNIKIRRVALPEATAERTNVYQSLFLDKDGNTFLRINQLSPGVAGELLFFNDSGRLVFRASTETQGWSEGVSYGPMAQNERPLEGEHYIDINLDGVFDMMFRFNEDGKFERILAHIDDEWKVVDDYDPKEYTFIVEDKQYSFEYWKQRTKSPPHKENATDRLLQQ